MLTTTRRLHGENPLVQQNQHQSTHAYDKNLLLRIGKSHSPGRSRSDLVDHHPSKLSIQTGGPAFQTHHVYDPSSRDIPFTSPTSAVSPASRYSWHEYSMDSRTPASESNSYSVDHDSTQRTMLTRPRLESPYTPADSRTRSERGSYDSAYSGGDDWSTIEERSRPLTCHGTKRRALSPPRETGYQSRQEPLKRLHSRPDLQATATNQPYKAGSLSSTASSSYHYSYVSSTMLSSASSMTSMSSLDTPLSREPSRQLFSSPASANGASGVAILPLRRAPEAANPILAQADLRAAPSRIGSYWICSCCPKKPRKFTSEEHLRCVQAMTFVVNNLTVF